MYRIKDKLTMRVRKQVIGDLKDKVDLLIIHKTDRRLWEEIKDNILDTNDMTIGLFHKKEKI